MEHYTLEVNSTGNTHVVIAFVRLSQDEDADAVCYFRGWLMRGDVLNVGEILTAEAHRKHGLASRLVLHAARVLRVATIQASVNSEEGEKLFASLKRNTTTFEVDYGY